MARGPVLSQTLTLRGRRAIAPTAVPVQGRGRPRLRIGPAELVDPQRKPELAVKAVASLAVRLAEIRNLYLARSSARRIAPAAKSR